MIKRFLRSRGAGKFRKNRLAMASLLVIVMYVLLSAYIVVTNVANDIGQKQGWFSLERRPLLGFLLVSQTRENFGPREMPGFGLRGDSDKQFESNAFFLELASNAFGGLDRLEEDSGREPREVLEDYAITGRPFADVPIEELRAMYQRARGESEAAVVIRSEIVALGTTLVKADKLARFDTELKALIQAGQGGSDEAFNRQEDIAFTLEEIAEGVERYQDTAPGEDALTEFDVAPLYDAANAIFDGQDIEGDQYDRDLIAGLVGSVEEVEGGLEARLGEQIERLTPVVEELFPPPTGFEKFLNDVRMILGTDRQGRSILIRALYSAKIAIQVGVVVALIAVGFGSVLGAAGAFFGGWVDHVVNWLYSMFTSIPYLVLLAVLAMLFIGSPFEGTLIPLYVAFSLTYWIGPCRVIRGEAMKIKELEYVQAATAIGFGRWYILLRHIIPNTAHLMFINFSLLLIGAIKGEVILTFLGLGLKQGASWGIMIRDSRHQVVDDNFWQIGAATFFMFLLVLAFNIFTDALQDAFDPKHVG